MQLISRDIIIGENAFIGARAMVLPGVKIGNNSIVGAQAVVTKNVPNNEVFAGNPAKRLENIEIFVNLIENKKILITGEWALLGLILPEGWWN